MYIPLIVFGVFMLAGIGGLIFYTTKSDKAHARSLKAMK